MTWYEELLGKEQQFKPRQNWRQNILHGTSNFTTTSLPHNPTTHTSQEKPFLLLLGYTAFSPPYKGYNIFWDAIPRMLPPFRENIAILIIGGMPELREDQDLDMDVTAVPWVPEDVLPLLYSRAAAFVYPSLMEGFGMPPIEAIACGCPVILGKSTHIRLLIHSNTHTTTNIRLPIYSYTHILL